MTDLALYLTYLPNEEYQIDGYFLRITNARWFKGWEVRFRMEDQPSSSAIYAKIGEDGKVFNAIQDDLSRVWYSTTTHIIAKHVGLLIRNLYLRESQK